MERIIMDVDPGIDDSLAIILALMSDEIKVEGITVVSGNIEVEKGIKNAFKAVSMAGKGRPGVYRGMSKPLEKEYNDASDTHGADGLGGNFYPDTGGRCEDESAVDYLVRMADENPGEITLVALAPLTNVAAAIEKAPQSMKKLKRIMLMGGSAGYPGNCSPVAEFNFLTDPKAAEIVFKSGIDITMFGLDATHSIILTPNLREVINQFGNELSRYIVEITRFYVDFHWRKERTIGCVINDPLVVAALLCPDVVELEDAYVRIVTSGIAEGQSVTDFGGTYSDGLCNAHVAVRADPKVFFDIFMKRLFPKFKKDIDIALSWEFRG